MKEKQSKKIFTRMLMNELKYQLQSDGVQEYVNLFSGKSGSVSLPLWMRSRLFYMEAYLPHS